MNEFAEDGIKENEKVVLMLTDGAPKQLKDRSYPYSRSKMKESFYLANQVPTSAKLLKESGVRIALVGVPDRNNRVPNEDYFRLGSTTGELCDDKGKHCERHGEVKYFHNNKCCCLHL